MSWENRGYWEYESRVCCSIHSFRGDSPISKLVSWRLRFCCIEHFQYQMLLCLLETKRCFVGCRFCGKGTSWRVGLEASASLCFCSTWLCYRKLSLCLEPTWSHGFVAYQESQLRQGIDVTVVLFAMFREQLEKISPDFPVFLLQWRFGVYHDELRQITYLYCFAGDFDGEFANIHDTMQLQGAYKIHSVAWAVCYLPLRS